MIPNKRANFPVHIALLSLALVSISTSPVRGQEAPSHYALQNARLVTVSGGVIDGGTIVIRNGVIVAMGGAETEVPAGAWLLDGTGLTVVSAARERSYGGRSRPCGFRSYVSNASR